MVTVCLFAVCCVRVYGFGVYYFACVCVRWLGFWFLGLGTLVLCDCWLLVILFGSLWLRVAGLCFCGFVMKALGFLGTLGFGFWGVF